MKRCQKVVQACIDGLSGGGVRRRRKVDHLVGDAAQSFEAGAVVEIGFDRYGTEAAPAGPSRTVGGVPQDGTDPVASSELCGNTRSDITTPGQE